MQLSRMTFLVFLGFSRMVTTEQGMCKVCISGSQIVLFQE
jgi:hypothetical protein